MTSEQIKIVNNIKFSIIKAIDNIELEQMWEMIEKAHEQKEKDHCEDCISRKGALRHRHIIYDDEGIGYSVVRVDEIEQLPPVTPQQKVGHWIDVETLDSAIWHECSECGEIEFYATDYCSNCGAKMEVEE